MQKIIFVVDDSDTNLTKAEQALENHYRVLTMSSAARMFEILQKITPDLILLDIDMPQMNGIEALQSLKLTSRYAATPVIFLTALTDASVEAKGFDTGAVDFITKPFSPPVLINRVKLHLDMDNMIRERTARLYRLKDSIVSVMASLVEGRDETTGSHIERTTKYMRILLEAMLAQGVYAVDIKGWDIEIAISSARLHDVGKIVVPDYILNKPGRLSAEEFDIIKKHTLKGEEIIDRMMSQTDEEDFLKHAKDFAGYHHERWDGAGYPRRLKGYDIPLKGRIMALVDVYDALVSTRPYKKAFTHEDAVAIIKEESGRHFDPAITQVFLEASNKFNVVM